MDHKSNWNTHNLFQLAGSPDIAGGSSASITIMWKIYGAWQQAVVFVLIMEPENSTFYPFRCGKKPLFLTPAWKWALNNAHRWHFHVSSAKWIPGLRLFYGENCVKYPWQQRLTVNRNRKKSKRILGHTGTSKSPEQEKRKDPSDHNTQGNHSLYTNSS